MHITHYRPPITLHSVYPAIEARWTTEKAYSKGGLVLGSVDGFSGAATFTFYNEKGTKLTDVTVAKTRRQPSRWRQQHAK